ncbi:MAG: AAA family ATPase [Anaerolineales bacterium]
MNDDAQMLLHRLGPYLPTDRFRALLAGDDLATETVGAAMFVDVSGFTPLTVQLVEEFGPQRASEELKRRLNPMFEALAGLVFTHGGSVLRFVGDGFTAWFPNQLQHVDDAASALPGIVRASVAAIEMLETMVFFRGLDIKVAVYEGTAQRWVVGDPQMGLMDILVGPAVEGVADLGNRCQAHQARAAHHSQAALANYPHVHYDILPDNDLLLRSAGAHLVERSASHRWPAWKPSADEAMVLARIMQFIDPYILEQETAGLGAISGELRYATPLFLRFGGIDYNHDPHARQTLDAYIRDVQQVIRQTRGRLVSLEVADKGSVIFAVYGAPISHGDDSRRAIYCAFSLRELHRQHPAISDYSIGISRGLLYSGTMGGEVRHEYTSLGDETNLASRLMSAAIDTHILVSKAIFDESRDWFDFEKSEVIQPKGRMGDVQTYTPLKAKQQVVRDLRRTPLMGRTQELHQVDGILQNAALGLPAILHFEGSAGVGKTRIAAEIAYFAENEGHWVAKGQTLSTGQGSAFMPWASILRSILVLDENWPTTLQIEQVSTWLERNDKAWLPRAPLITGDILNLTVEDNDTTRNLLGNNRQEALVTLVVDMLYFMTKNQILTLILEDIQWLDEVSEGLLAALARRMANEPARIAVFLFSRPPEQDLTTTFKAITHLPVYQLLRLKELNREAIGDYLYNLLGGIIPDELTAFVHERSQGNPFFAGEIAQSLRNSQLIQRVGPHVYIEDNLEKIDLPQTVQGLILARLDNLPETEKLILKVAAIIGRQFEMRVLYQSLPLDLSAEVVMDKMDALEKHGFTQLESLYPEPRYAFRHTITQEVTYQTLLFDQRQDWHYRVGLCLETLQPQAWERLAYHFSQTSDRDRALLYLVRAGDKAFREFANQAALEYWGTALDLARSEKERFDLLCKRAEVLLRTADWAQTEQDLHSLAALADNQPDNLNWQLRRHRLQAEYAINRRDYDTARAASDAALSILEDYQDQDIAWELHSIQLRLYDILQDQERYTTASYNLREIANALNDPTKGLRLMLNDFAELAQDAPYDALQGLDGAYDEIIQQSDPILEANYWGVVSGIAIQNRFLKRAESAVRNQLRLWQQVGNRRMEANTLHNLGLVLYYLGQYSEAGIPLRAAYDLAKQLDDQWNLGDSLVLLGALAYRRRAYGEASAYIERGLAQLRQVNSTFFIGRGLYLLALVLLAQQAFDKAESTLHEAHRILSTNYLPDYLAQIELGMAFIAQQQKHLRPLDDIHALLSPLLSHRFVVYNDPDVACWQAYYLLQAHSAPLDALRASFLGYLQGHLATLDDPIEQAAFLDSGYTVELTDLLDIRPEDLKQN